MMIELEAYSIECPSCKNEIEFLVNQVDGLAKDINDECDAAATEAEKQFEAQYAGMVDPSDLPVQPRWLHDLSQAIAQGDLAEARIWCDRIAYELGIEHDAACQIGRFARVPV
jgi:copper chaperone CopZ